jgi:hypothetical protein
MTVVETATQRQPLWRRVASVLIAAYLVLGSLGFLLMTVFSVSSGSMDLNGGTSSGVLLTGTFHYRFHNTAKGRTVDLPVTTPAEYTDPGRVVVDANAPDSIDASDFTAFGDGRGSVTLPPGVHLGHESNPDTLLQSLRIGNRLTLSVDSPVGWRGRLLVSLPSVLIWVGMWIATVTFGLFLRSIVNGQPFHPINPRRLLTLGGALTLTLFADGWLRVWIVRAMLDVLNQHGHPIPLQVDDPSISPLLFCVIIGVFCLAAAFRIGARMATDTEGLV